MATALEQLPPNIQVHVKSLTKNAGLSDTEESYEKLAQGWLDKKNAFEKDVREQGMKEVDSLAKDAQKGAVALTYSGSLVLIGPLIDGVRKGGYNSIGIRKDVPKTILKEDSKLAADIQVDQVLKFEVGPVQSTSAIFKIAVCEEEMEALVEEEKISEVTIIVTNNFVDINQALVPTE